MNVQTKSKDEMTLSQGGVTVDDVRRIAEENGEPDWLILRRVKALENYNLTELPSRVLHLWRYTDPSTFCLDSKNLSFASANAAVKDKVISLLGEEDLSGHAIVTNGAFVESQLDDNAKEANVMIECLHRAALEHGSAVQDTLGNIVPAEHGKFEALNMTAWRGGVFVNIPRNVVVEKPIHIAISSDDTSEFLAHRFLVLAGESSEVNIVLELSSPNDADILANVVAEIYVASNAKVRLVTVSRWGNKATFHYTQRTAVQRDANLEIVWAGLGGKTTKCDLGTKMLGPGANTRFWGLNFAQNRQHFDAHTEHWHAEGNTSSDMDFKIVLKDKARSIYTGLIRIDHHARNCEAYQENRNLLLSEGPLADTIPELEILNEDVKCSHGATVGPVDENELFYLQSRGIPRDEATRIVVGGFIESTLNHVPEQVKDRLVSYVVERLREI